MKRDNEDEIEELVNDFDMEFIAPKEIELTDNPDNVNALILASNLHVVDQGTTHTKEELETKKEKNPEESTPITWKCKISPHSQKNCLVEGRVVNQFDESASVFNIYEQIINLDILTEILGQQSNLYSQQNLRKFLTNVWEIKVIIGVNYIITVNQLPSIPMFWDCNHFVGKVGIQNIFARTRYQVVLKKSLC